MRGDMPKVIVERPRRGGKNLRKGRSVRDDDLAVSKIGMLRHARLRGGYKELNENLAPLRRYLESQVGRPWDKVWSEICAKLKPANTVQQHVRDHIPDFVAIKTSLRDGKVWVHDRYDARPLERAFSRLYVDPKTGILRRNKHFKSWSAGARAARAAAEKERAARLRDLGPNVQAHLLADGAWWRVELAPVPTAEEPYKTRHGITRRRYELAVTDVVLAAGLSTLARAELYGREGVYAVAKRQLSKKEMRDLDLR